MTQTVPTVRVGHGTDLPVLGLGTWPMDDATAERAVAQALDLGYRLVDTAENYQNERGVGRGLRASGVPRGEVFLTTKINRRWHGRELVGEACQRSLERLGVDYVDLLLIHWPNPEQDRYVSAWEGLVDVLAAGRVRAIGTSNFKPDHLQRIIEATGVAPDVNQIELSPLAQRTGPRRYHGDHGIITQAWSPFGGNGTPVLHNATVRQVADRHGRTPAQVTLRWILQQGVVTIPKSTHPERMRTNLAVFDFELADHDLAALGGLDQGEAAVTDSDVYGH